MAKTKRTKTAKSTSSKSPGRPPGSRTKPAADIDCPLPRCARCQGSQFEVLSTRERDMRGRGPGGAPFTSRVWRRARCQHCGQINVLHAWPFDPEKWDRPPTVEESNPQAVVPVFTPVKGETYVPLGRKYLASRLPSIASSRRRKRK